MLSGFESLLFVVMLVFAVIALVTVFVLGMTKALIVLFAGFIVLLVLVGLRFVFGG